jgi:hypothetical protein
LTATLEQPRAFTERSDADHAFDFLQSWIVENVNPTMNEDGDMMEHLAGDCAWEAKTRGITKADLTEAAGGAI